MGAWMLIVIAGACVGLGCLMILLTAQHLNSEINELTQRIEELERELLHVGEEQLKKGEVAPEAGESPR